MGFIETVINIISGQLVNILIALGVGLFFFVLTPWGLKKYLKTAYVERKNRAIENILDLLESSLIFKQDFNPTKILHLVNAIGREYTIDVFSYTTTKSLLEELELRFEKSKHLDPNQKQEYTRKIETLINDLEKEDEKLKIHIPYENLFSELEKNVNNAEKELALRNIITLKQKIIQRPDESNSLDYKIMKFLLYSHNSKAIIYIYIIAVILILLNEKFKII
jgi:hypothetical protein